MEGVFLLQGGGGGGGGGKGRFPREQSSIRSRGSYYTKRLSFRDSVVGDREEKIREGRRERERRGEEERQAILRRSSIPGTARNPERATVLEPTPETMSAGRVAVLGALTQRTSPQAINEAFA